MGAPSVYMAKVLGVGLNVGDFEVQRDGLLTVLAIECNRPVYRNRKRYVPVFSKVNFLD